MSSMSQPPNESGWAPYGSRSCDGSQAEPEQRAAAALRHGGAGVSFLRASATQGRCSGRRRACKLGSVRFRQQPIWRLLAGAGGRALGCELLTSSGRREHSTFPRNSGGGCAAERLSRCVCACAGVRDHRLRRLRRRRGAESSWCGRAGELGRSRCALRPSRIALSTPSGRRVAHCQCAPHRVDVSSQAKSTLSAA